MNDEGKFNGQLLWLACLGILLGLLLSTLMGCKSIEPETVYERVEVQVPVAIAPEPIELRDEPAWLLPTLPAESPATEKLRALVTDLGMCHDYLDYILYIIGVYNEAAVEFGTGLGDLAGDPADAGGDATD